MLYAIAAVIVFAGGGVVYIGTRRARLKFTMDRQATTDIANVRSNDYVEVKGRAECETAIVAPHVDIECIYYDYKLERRERSHGSASGTSRNRYRWVTIDSGSEQVPFTLTDSSGSLNVVPEGADFDAPIVAKRSLDGDISGSFGAGMVATMLSSFAGMANPQRITVRAIRLQQDLYVLGNVLSGSGKDATIGKGSDTFFISTKSEDELKRSLFLQSVGYYAIGAALAVAGFALAVAEIQGKI